MSQDVQSARDAQHAPINARRLSDSGLAAAVKSYVIERVIRRRSSSAEGSRLDGNSPVESGVFMAGGVADGSDDRDRTVVEDEVDEDTVDVPALLVRGVAMLKVNAKTIKPRVFKLDPDRGHILWDSKKLGVVAVENIEEIRTDGPLSSISKSHPFLTSPLWLTIIYVTSLKYRALNLIAPTEEIRDIWISALRSLVRHRREMMGLPLALTVGSAGDEAVSAGQTNELRDAWERRRDAWLRRCWKSADGRSAGVLDWNDVEALCVRLSVCTSKEELQLLFNEADVSNRGSLDFSDFKRFIALLKRRPDVERLYDKLCTESGGVSGHFTSDVFVRSAREYQKDMRPEDELRAVFRRYAVPLESESDQSAALDGDERLSESPGNERSESDQRFSESPTPRAADEEGSSTILQLPLASFSAFLLSADNSPLVESTYETCHVMDRPLAEYYISSSHNTYLLGHQLVGDSTVEGYVRALLHGCRTVEVDLYDGDAGPVITHGRTLTTSVSLRDVAHVIAKYAFVASPYPVIISAEIHCSLHQQDAVAEILKSVLGEMLVVAPLESLELFDELPSPGDLKYRILLKAKNLYIRGDEEVQQVEFIPEEDTPSMEVSSPSDMEFQSQSSDFSGSSVLVMPLSSPPEFQGDIIRGPRFASPLETKHPMRPSTPSDSPLLERGRSLSTLPTRTLSESKPRMSTALLSLLVYTVGVKWRGLNKKERYAVEHMFSLSERTANKIIKHNMYELIKHNRSHLVRVYPSGTRLSSTNFDPQTFWAAGVQLAAINWQTSDLGYMINHAMFQRNGRCGYVLKPFALRTKDKELLRKRERLYFDVTIISAQQLPRPGDESGCNNVSTKSVMDPFVEVSLHVPEWPSIPAQAPYPSQPYVNGQSGAKPISLRTIAIKNNGFNPVWEETLSIPFDCVGDMLELVFVRFSVRQEGKDDDHLPLAVYCVSLGSLKPGYRHLPLHDVQMSPYLFSTLFVHTSVRSAL